MNKKLQNGKRELKKFKKKTQKDQQIGSTSNKWMEKLNNMK